MSGNGESSWDIIVRVRPHDEKKGPSAVGVKDESILLVEENEKTFEYEFCRVYDENAEQKDIFDENVAHLVESAIRGTNISVFAYGPTGTGKTFTMLGTATLPGVIPRTLQYLLNRLREVDSSTGGSSELGISYLEVYNEKIKDLLSSEEKDIKIREDKGEITLSGLVKLPITDFDSFRDIFLQANERRSVSATKLNNESSRSHSVLTLYMASKRKSEDGKMIQAFSKINLIDLAGSEDNRRTGNAHGSAVFKESTKINLSLTVLKRVVKALSLKQSSIPYRESKLTRILIDCLGGNAHSVMFLMVAPEEQFLKDTLSSLSFSKNAKKVSNQPLRNIKEEILNTPSPERKGPRPALVDALPTSPLICTPIRDVRRLEREALAMASKRKIELQKKKIAELQEAKRLKSEIKSEEVILQSTMIQPNDNSNPNQFQMSDIPEMSIQSTLIEDTLKEDDISHSKTTKNALADVSNSTVSQSVLRSNKPEEKFMHSLNLMEEGEVKKLKFFPKKMIPEFLTTRPFQTFDSFRDFIGSKKADKVFLKNY